MWLFFGYFEIIVWLSFGYFWQTKASGNPGLENSSTFFFMVYTNNAKSIFALSVLSIMTSCAAVGCLNNVRKKDIGNDGKQITFFQFPKDPAVLNQWLIRMRRMDSGRPYKPTSASRMCSEHFVETDFDYQPFTSKLHNY